MGSTFTRKYNFSQLRGRVRVACEQAFGRAGNWGEEIAKRPVDIHLGPPFRASDPDASSHWRGFDC